MKALFQTLFGKTIVTNIIYVTCRQKCVLWSGFSLIFSAILMHLGIINFLFFDSKRPKTGKMIQTIDVVNELQHNPYPKNYLSVKH